MNVERPYFETHTIEDAKAMTLEEFDNLDYKALVILKKELPTVYDRLNEKSQEAAEAKWTSRKWW